MKIYSFFIIIICILLLTSCDLIPNQKSKSTKKVENGVQISKKYYDDGTLKTEISVKNKKKNGPAKKYYSTGELHTLVNYVNNIKEGEAIWYYRNGQPYRVTNYNNGKIDGIRKYYYENGLLQAEIPYKKGELQEGTQEYNKLGTPISNDTEILFETINNLKFENKYTLIVKLSEKHKKTEFLQEVISTEGTKILVPLRNEFNRGVIESYVPKGSHIMTILKIYVKYETEMGHPVLLSTSYNLVVEN